MSLGEAETPGLFCWCCYPVAVPEEPTPLSDDIDDVLRNVILPEYEAAKEDLRILLQEARRKHRRALNALKRRQAPRTTIEELQARQARNSGSCRMSLRRLCGR